MLESHFLVVHCVFSAPPPARGAESTMHTQLLMAKIKSLLIIFLGSNEINVDKPSCSDDPTWPVTRDPQCRTPRRTWCLTGTQTCLWWWTTTSSCPSLTWSGTTRPTAPRSTLQVSDKAGTPQVPGQWQQVPSGLSHRSLTQQVPP